VAIENLTHFENRSMIFPALNLNVDPGLEGIVFAPGSRSPILKAPLDNTELQDLERRPVFQRALFGSSQWNEKSNGFSLSGVFANTRPK